MTLILIILFLLLFLPQKTEAPTIITKPKSTPLIIDQEPKDEPIERVQDEKRKRRVLPRILRKTRNT